MTMLGINFWKGNRSEADRRAERMAEAAAAAARGDYETAQNIWVAYAQSGDHKAQAEIGQCFLNGWGVEQNLELAHRWLTLAANANEPMALRLLGDYHFDGKGGRPEPSIAEECYARAASQGDAIAQHRFSRILIEGEHRRPDYKQGRE